MKTTVYAMLAVIAALSMSTAHSAPPYSVTPSFTAASGATSHRLYRGCQAGETKVLMATVVSGQVSSATLSAAGQYSFCVHGVNAAGEGPASNIVVANISDVQAPGSPSNFTITISCPFLPDGVTPSCTVTTSP